MLQPLESSALSITSDHFLISLASRVAQLLAGELAWASMPSSA